jgi:hypothetical protein
MPCIKMSHVHAPYPNSTRIIGFSNDSNWLISFLILMDMFILTKGMKHVFFHQSTWLKKTYLTNTSSQVEQPWSKWSLGFNQMQHIVKLNIRYTISEDDQCSLIKWDILCLLHTYLLLPTYNFTIYLSTNTPTYLNLIPTYQLTHLLTYYLPIYLPN